MVDANQKRRRETGLIEETLEGMVGEAKTMAEEADVIEALEERAIRSAANDLGAPEDHPVIDAELVGSAKADQSAKPSRLRDAMRRVRTSEVERADVIVDLRETEIARLELLREHIADVFDDVPEDADLLEGRVLPGTPPRLWIDVIAHVVMDRDKRTYRFVQETRNGRLVMANSSSMDTMGSAITDYVAQRLIDRERALAAEFAMRPSSNGKVIAPQALSDTEAALEEKPASDETQQVSLTDASSEAKEAGVAEFGAVTSVKLPEPAPIVVGHSGLAMAMAFLFGTIAGAFILFMIGLNYAPV